MAEFCKKNAPVRLLSYQMVILIYESAVTTIFLKLLTVVVVKF